MLINVIIPSYNYGRFLEISVSSVLNQNCADLRIIIVDDGSVDNTKEICKAMAEKDKRITYIYQQNGGVSSARNKGIEYVLKNRQGFEYIAFLDADDLWRKDFFNQKVISIIEEKNDIIGFEMCRCAHNLKKVSEEYELLETPFGKPAEKEYRVIRGGAESVRCHENSPMGAMLYSADLLKKTGIRFFSGLKFSEDKIFKMQCLYAAKEIALLKRVMYLYRANESSAMKTVKFDSKYYIPIIDAYIKCDRQMQYLKDTDAGELCWGRTLASLYTTEMIDEHFRFFGKEDEIRKVLDDNPYFVENLRDFAFYDERIQNWIDAVKSSKQKYIARQRIIGIKHRAIEIAKSSAVLRKIKDKKTYSLENIYI